MDETIAVFSENNIRQIFTLMKTSIGNKLEVKLVEQLPTGNIDSNVIYLIEKSTDAGTKICDIYMYNNGWIKFSSNDTSESDIQINTIPTAGAENKGKIIQYTGETTEDFVRGNFYECVELDTDPVTYTWKPIDVQQKSKPTLVGETLIF